MKDKYYEQAVTCVKDTVLPAQIRLYKSCGGDFDKIYGEAMNGNGYFVKVAIFEKSMIFITIYWMYILKKRIIFKAKVD